MAAIYDVTLIASDLKTFARAKFRDVGGLVGTTVTLPLLLDEEYQGFIARLGPNEGLAQLAESLAANYAQKIDEYAEAGGISVAWPDRPEFYLELAASIRKNGIDGGAGGQIVSGVPLTPNSSTDCRLRFAGDCGCGCD